MDVLAQTSDVLVIIRDGVINRTVGMALKDIHIPCIMAADPKPEDIQRICIKSKPAITCVGEFLIRDKVEANDLKNFKVLLTYYRLRYQGRVPVILIYHEDSKDIPRLPQFKDMLYTLRVPAMIKTNELQNMIVRKLMDIDEELDIGMPVFHKKVEKPVEKKPAVVYSEKDFKPEYSMKEHKLILAGPLVGRASAKIDMLLKNQKVHEDVKQHGERDKGAKRILKIDWKDVNFIAEKAAHYTFVILRDLMKNGVYEVIKFENFEEKRPMFANQTHYELFYNRFCAEE